MDASELAAALRPPGLADVPRVHAGAGDRLFDVAAALGARIVDSHADGCTLELPGAVFRLEVLRGPAGEHVLGSTDLREISPSLHARQVLLGLYLADRLSAELGFPVWCSLDHATHAFRLCFAVAAGALESGGLAEVIRRVYALRIDPGLLIGELA